jgi:hypothetical protein
VGAHDAAAGTATAGGHKGRPYDIPIPFPRRVFRVRAVKSILHRPPPTNAGTFLFFPSPPKQREAERRQAWGKTFRTGQVRQRAKRARSPVGVPPRLSPRGLTSPKAQLRPGFLGRGLSGRYPPSPVLVQRTPRAPVIVPVDVMPKPPGERAVSSRPRAPHSLRLPQIPSRKPSCTERVRHT